MAFTTIEILMHWMAETTNEAALKLRAGEELTEEDLYALVGPEDRLVKRANEEWDEENKTPARAVPCLAVHRDDVEDGPGPSELPEAGDGDHDESGPLPSDADEHDDGGTQTDESGTIGVRDDDADGGLE
jgi:hypothetical protein